jgi:RNA ligase (TIGR02306 family)
MSTLIVEVCTIEEVKQHPNADKVELVRCKNWWCVSGIGQYKVGDKVVYFPPDSVIPEELAEKFGIAKYCAQLPKNADGTRPTSLRIKAQRFRGESSFGTVQTPDDPNWEVGYSVKEYYGVEKYEPPIRATDGDADHPVSAFHGYTNIENIGNFPGVFEDGEEVVIDEKIHGSNSRIGLILHPDEETGVASWIFMCGSNSVRRREFNLKGVRSFYWDPLTENMKQLLTHLSQGKANVIVFGEIFGAGVQDMQYGQPGRNYRSFDIAVDGKYLDDDVKKAVLSEFGIEMVPHLYRGPFSMEKVKELTDGPTTVCDPTMAGKFPGREGIVIRPVKERYSAKLPNFGRVILKSISADYLGRKGGTEYH